MRAPRGRMAAITVPRGRISGFLPLQLYRARGPARIRKVGLCHDCFQRDLDDKKGRGRFQPDLTRDSIWANYGKEQEY